jgi:hypothetical protein
VLGMCLRSTLIIAAIGTASSAASKENSSAFNLTAAIQAFICSHRRWEETSIDDLSSSLVAVHRRVIGDITYILAEKVLLAQDASASTEGLTFLKLYNANDKVNVYSEAAFPKSLATATLNQLGLSDMLESRTEYIPLGGQCSSVEQTKASSHMRKLMAEVLVNTLRHEVFTGISKGSVLQTPKIFLALVGEFSSLDQFTYAYVPVRQ